MDRRRTARMQYLISLCLALVTVGCGKSNDAQDATKAAADQSSSGAPHTAAAAGVQVPVGGVILWWGSKNEIPPNFELCDGREPTTPGATMKGNKPDLADCFVKGAEKADAGRADLGAGGTNALDLTHAHGSSKLTALIGTHDQRQFLSYQERGQGFAKAHWQIRAESAGRPAGGTSSSTAVSGDSDPALTEKVDNRPAFQEMFFIIRVK